MKKRIIAMVLSLSMLLSAIPTVFAEELPKYPEPDAIGDTFAITYPEPVNEDAFSEFVDADMTSEPDTIDIQNEEEQTTAQQEDPYLSKRTFLSDLVLGSETAVSQLREHYKQYYGSDSSAEQEMQTYFTPEELSMIVESNAQFDMEQMSMLFLLFMNTDAVSEEEKQTVQSLILEGHSIYEGMLAVVKHEYSGKLIEECLRRDVSLFDTLQTMTGDAGSLKREELYTQKLFENQYKFSNGGAVNIGTVNGNVTYSYNLVTVPGKNGLNMNLTINYDSSNSSGVNYDFEESADDYGNGPGFRTNVEHFSMGSGWRFALTHKENNHELLTLSDGRSFKIKGDGTLDTGRYAPDDVKLCKDADGTEYVQYLDGTREYLGTNGYVSKKQDKYGNSITYEYYTENWHEYYRDEVCLTKISDGTRNIYIDYYTNKTVIERPDGTTIELRKETMPLSNIGTSEKLSISQDVPILKEIYDTNTQFSLGEFSYQPLETCYYAGRVGKNLNGWLYSVYMMMTECKGQYADSHTFTYTTHTPQNGNFPSNIYAGVKTHGRCAENEAFETYSYSAKDETQRQTTCITSDNLKTVTENNLSSNSYVTKTYADNVLKQFVSVKTRDSCDSRPETRTSKIFSNQGNYLSGDSAFAGTIDCITYQTDYTYNEHGQTLTEKTQIDGVSDLDTDYTYTDDAYSTLQSVAVKKGTTPLLKQQYTVNAFGDVTYEGVYDDARSDFVHSSFYEYDEYHNLVKKTASKTGTDIVEQEEYEFDNDHRYPIRTVTRDTNGSVISDKRYTYDTMGYITAANDGRYTTGFTYDALGNLIKEKYPDDTETNITYYTTDHAISVKNEKGLVTEYFYNGSALKEVTEYHNIAAEPYYYKILQTITYDSLMRPVQVKDANNNISSISYDPLGRQTNVVNPPVDGKPSESKAKYYDVFLEGNKKYAMSMIISPENKISCKYYDVHGRLVKTAAVNNPDTLLAVSNLDTLTSMPSNIQLIVTGTYAYDDLGRMIRQTDGAGRPTTYTYDAAGNVLTATQGTGTETVSVSYEYNIAGKLVKMTQGDHVTTYEYDRAGRLIKTTDPMGFTEQTEYDLAGNISRSKDKNNSWTSNTYDSRNRLIQGSKGGQNITYTYDAAGNILTIADVGGIIKYEYNIDGTKKKVTMPDGKFMTYDTYDNAKQLLQYTDYFGKATAYTYTGGSYIKTVTAEDDTVNYRYYADGSVALTEFPNGTETAYSYNTLGLTTVVNNRDSLGSYVYTNQYAYDNSGNITTKAVTANGIGQTTQYTYDSVNRLVKEDMGNWKFQSYEYDRYNNIKSAIKFDRDTTYQYDANNRLIEENYCTDIDYDCYYSYDNNGNLVEKIIYEADNIDVWGGWADYTYNVWGQLTSYRDMKGSSASYSYYADGTRRSKTVADTTYGYYYSGQYVVNETKKVGTNTAEEYASNVIGVGGIVGRYGTQTGWFMKDAHGDVLGAYAGNGITKVADYTYDAWGNQTNESYSWWADENPIRYAGEYYDTESGLIYLRARYYDSSMGRFLSEDPIKDGVNWYAYCGNNPIIFVDPTGLVGVTADGTVVYGPDDSQDDILLMQLKVDYSKATTQEEKDAIALEAKEIRENSTQKITVLANIPLEDYLVLDITNILRYQFKYNANIASSHKWDAEWFRGMVTHKAEWDVKRENRWKEQFDVPYPSLTNLVIFDGKAYTPEQIGNMMYGYTGSAAGFSPVILFAGGGYAANGALAVIQDGYPYFSDSLDDHNMIQAGIDLYNKNF